MVNARILVVEDEIIVAMDIQNTLESLGYAVPAIASSGEEAIEKTAETHPDLALMDIKLQGDMDGVEAAKQIRTRFDIPVIYLTAYADDETLERAKITGPFGYILKPFEARELHSAISMALYRHEIDKRLKESEARYRAVSELASDFAYSFRVEPDGTLAPEWLTEAFTRITGFTPGEVEARGDWTSIVHPDDRSIVLQHLQAILSGQQGASELCIVTKNDEMRWLHVYNCPVWDEAQGRVVRVIGAARDITERKQAEERIRELNAELEQLVADLRRSNAELEQFAYVASHDLQEPLRMVTDYLELLEQRYKGKLDANADEFIAYAIDGATRMQEMIKGLLAYSKVGMWKADFEPTDCEVVLEHTLANLQVAIEESGAVVTHAPLPTVMADNLQLSQVFQNLISNAIKFRGEEPPRVHVSAERLPLSQAGKDEWVFSVCDNGIGIDQEHTEHIFQVFQRLHTREKYPGTGIGLATCKKIVERHGGRIWVESQPGKGSTFYFTIPAALNV